MHAPAYTPAAKRNTLTDVSPCGEMHALVFPRTKSGFAQRAITLHKSDH